jgi:hypothetical protein
MAYYPDEALFVHSFHTVIIDRNGRLAANLEGNNFTAQQLGDLVQTLAAHGEERSGANRAKNAFSKCSEIFVCPLRRLPKNLRTTGPGAAKRLSKAIGQIEIERLRETQCEDTAGLPRRTGFSPWGISALMFCQFYPAIGSARINQGKKTPPSGRLLVSRGRPFLNLLLAHCNF